VHALASPARSGISFDVTFSRNRWSRSVNPHRKSATSPFGTVQSNIVFWNCSRPRIPPLSRTPLDALAKALHLSPSRIGDIVLERRGVTADTAVRLARYFGGTAQFWLNLQSIYDLRTAERAAETKRALREIEPLEHSAAA